MSPRGPLLLHRICWKFGPCCNLASRFSSSLLVLSSSPTTTRFLLSLMGDQSRSRTSEDDATLLNKLRDVQLYCYQQTRIIRKQPLNTFLVYSSMCLFDPAIAYLPWLLSERWWLYTHTDPALIPPQLRMQDCYGLGGERQVSENTEMLMHHAWNDGRLELFDW